MGFWNAAASAGTYMQTVCTSLQTDNHNNTSSVNLLQARCSSWRPTNSVKALKATQSTDRQPKT